MVDNFQFRKKFKVSFLKFFCHNHKKRHTSNTTKIWALILGGKIRNIWEYSDIFQLQIWDFQILKKKNQI